MPYDYTVEVTNRLKGLDLIDRVPEELWTEVCDIVQEAVIKIIPKEKNAKRQNGCLRRAYRAEKRSKKYMIKGKIYPFECRVPENSKER